MEAYLDIETSYERKITVIGIYREDKDFLQLVNGKINRTNLLRSLSGTRSIVTYNGSRFDLPVIRRKLGVDLKERFESDDLMLTCWHHNIYGGLKRVEEYFGISRSHKEIDGQEAMRLWHLYKNYDDDGALRLLLEYNKDDVMNLVLLKKRLIKLG